GALSPRVRERALDQHAGDALPPQVSPHEEAWDGPGRQVVHRLEQSRALEAWEGLPRLDRAPAHRPPAPIPEDTGDGAVLDQPPEGAAILLALPRLVDRPREPRVHAPAPTARPARPEQALEVRPSRRGERADEEPRHLHGPRLPGPRCHRLGRFCSVSEVEGRYRSTRSISSRCVLR